MHISDTSKLISESFFFGVETLGRGISEVILKVLL